MLTLFNVSVCRLRSPGHNIFLTMDAIRKKMKSLKSETDQLNTVIRRFEEETQDAVARAEQADLDIRSH